MTLQDYIKLAESATDGPWENPEHCSTGVFFRGKTAGGFDLRGCPDPIPTARFVAESRTLGPAMAKALIEAEEALENAKSELINCDNNSYTAMALNDVDKALSTIQALQENKNDR